MNHHALRNSIYAVFFSALALSLVWGASNCGTDLGALLDAGLDGGRVCTTSAQCRATEVCKNHVCVPAGTCTKKTDCAENEDCIGGKCVPFEGDGGLDGGGSDGGPGDGGGGCSGDGECAPGNRCNLSTHVCEPAAIISIEPADTLDFGAVPYGQEVKQSFTVTNKGRLALDVTGFDVQNPPDNACFKITSGGTAVRLAEGESRSVEVTYKQNGSHADSGKAIIASSDPVRPIYQLNLKSSYKGLPKFAIFVYDPVGGAWVKDYPKIGSGYEYPLDFGYVAQGSLKHKVLQIRNITDGDAILVLKDFSPLNTPKNKFIPVFRDGPDAASSNAIQTPLQGEPPTHLHLGAGEAAYLHVDYDAKNKEQNDGQDFRLSTNDNDVNGSGNPGTNSITLKMAAHSKASKIEVSPLALDFRQVQKNASAKQIVTISNSGDSDLKIFGASGIKFLTGTDYSTNPASLEKTVAAKSDFPVEVFFSPSKVSSENNILVINSDDADLPVIEVTLTGTGIDPTLMVVTNPAAAGTPPVMDFGKVLTGAKTTGTVTVTNTGLGDLLLSDVVLNQGAGTTFGITGMKLNGQAKTLPATLRELSADTLTFNIEFQPAVTGVMNASMVFKNSDIKNENYTINLSGISQYNKGQPCQGDGECSTGFCSDGVCCDLRCDEKCKSCSQEGYKGTCRTVNNGTQDPKGVCAATNPSLCGKTGNCTGGDCEIWPSTTVCAAALCTDGNLKLKPVQYCSGDLNQSCVDAAPVSCSPYICDGTLMVPACKTSCFSNFDCAPGYSCDPADNKCKLSIGQQCQTGGECVSGFCEDGVCCREKCDQACEACNLGAKVGDCSAVPKGDPDPKAKCEAKDPSTCKTDGKCSGSRGVCEYWDTLTVCEDFKCSTDRKISYKKKKCDGLGNCAPQGEVLCAPYACDTAAGTCNTACATDTDCAANARCDVQQGQATGVCRLIVGQPCASDAACFSGFCADGVCCGERCDSACEKCNLAGSVGTCSAVAAGTVDPRSKCAVTDKTTCGTDGKCAGTRGSCRKWPDDTVCVEPSCSGDVLNLPDKCNGAGVCVDGGTQNCSPYSCVSAACRAACTSNSDCTAGNSCDTASGVCKKNDGFACGGDGECFSGFCADGVCCNARCGGTCEKCSLAGSVGVCTAVPDGTDPDGECPDDGAASCKRNGVCDGGRKCRLYPPGAVCLASICADTTTNNVAHTCDGTGTCQEKGTESCFPYICSGGACKASCSTDGDCAPGYSCASGTCRKSDGQACTGGGECASGFCADGVCCNSLCAGICEKCSLTGNVGVCTAISDGTDPDGECPDDGAASCDRNGFCSGARACKLYASGTVCAASSCSSAVFTKADTCDGEGNCADNGTQACSPYLCNSAGCRTSCGTSADCVSNYSCVSGVCKKNNGLPCSVGSDCATGFCADTVCCNGACDGVCEHCNLVGQSGACSAIPADTDPYNECGDQGAASCGTSGNCSGTRSCRLYPVGAVCAAASCNGTVLTKADTCDGAGHCSDNGTLECSPHNCAGGACKNPCLSDGDCVSGYACASGSCKKPDGQTCTSGGECVTGYCVDGVCCNNLCGGPCEKCSLSGGVGTCTAVPDGTDPDNECQDDGAASCDRNGFCNGAGACKLYPSGTVCIEASCSGTVLTKADTCDGSGNCSDNGTKDCSPYACTGGACKDPCVTNGDCISGYTCVSGVCKKSNGQTCTSGGECATGYCIDGVCCNAACNGVCERCNLPLRAGYCDPIQAGTDPDNECSQDLVSTCGKDGFCSGSRSCELYALNTICVPASCSGDSLNPADKCNGLGTCVDSGSQSCVPYTCAAGACKSSCTVNGDCAANYSCAGGVCKKNDGQSCINDGDCYSGHCCGNLCTNFLTDDYNCGGCGNDCTTLYPNASGDCNSGSCEMTGCDVDWWNIDGNTTNGCEYSCQKTSETDLPDDLFTDANCDGIDGNIALSVFVSFTTGNDAYSGSKNSPFKTIQKGIDTANLLSPKRSVLVAAGNYSEGVTMADGVSVYGGYSTNWVRSNSYIPQVSVPAIGLRASGINTATTIDRINVTSANAAGSAASSYGIFVVNSTGLTVRRLAIAAGSGTAGDSGAAGTNGTGSGSPGSPGQPGCEESGGVFCSNCDRPLGGAGGASVCGGTGGGGGNASRGGDPGFNGSAGGPSGTGGAGGLGSVCCRGSSAPLASQYGGTGADGADAANGPGGGAFGTTSATGYSAANGTSGGAGTHGKGGGGGGGGGGGTSDCDSYGSSGGGGGGGGCAGTGGGGGGGAGGSFGMFLSNSIVSLDYVTITTSSGGTGGSGGNRGTGTGGGGGGAGGSYGGGGEQDDGSMGGPGGAGGRGGHGGHGGGGGGGPSVGIAKSGTCTVTQVTPVTFSLGSGGTGGTSSGNYGATGLRQNIYP